MLYDVNYIFNNIDQLNKGITDGTLKVDGPNNDPVKNVKFLFTKGVLVITTKRDNCDVSYLCHPSQFKNIFSKYIPKEN